LRRCVPLTTSLAFMSKGLACLTMDCVRSPTVRLRGMCEHEHLTENVYCDPCARYLQDIGEREGFLCYECRTPFGADPEPWHHDCPLSQLVASRL